MLTNNKPTDNNSLEEKEQKARIKYYTEGAKAYQDFQWLFAIIAIILVLSIIGSLCMIIGS